MVGRLGQAWRIAMGALSEMPRRLVAGGPLVSKQAQTQLPREIII
jgi:hypothetical protein